MNLQITLLYEWFRGNISSIFPSNSEANVLKLLENLQELFRMNKLYIIFHQNLIEAMLKLKLSMSSIKNMEGYFRRCLNHSRFENVEHVFRSSGYISLMYTNQQNEGVFTINFHFLSYFSSIRWLGFKNSHFSENEHMTTCIFHIFFIRVKISTYDPSLKRSTILIDGISN